jgi:sodium transport system ATP-binding protein
VLVGADLRKQYGRDAAVDGVSLELLPGEIVALTGPNGAGKTTLISLLAGLLVPDSGSVTIRGTELVPSDSRTRAYVGLVSPETRPYGRLSAAEMLRWFAELYEIPAPDIDTRVARVVEALELGPFLSKRCDTLSDGQRQRVSLARALLHDPAVLLLDEPTAALDASATAMLLDALARAARRGCAVLFASHDQWDTAAIAERAIVLSHGRVVAQETRDELRARLVLPPLSPSAGPP